MFITTYKHAAIAAACIPFKQCNGANIRSSILMMRAWTTLQPQPIYNNNATPKAYLTTAEQPYAAAAAAPQHKDAPLPPPPTAHAAAATVWLVSHVTAAVEVLLQ
jgi:hypothetical protein